MKPFLPVLLSLGPLALTPGVVFVLLPVALPVELMGFGVE